VASVAEAGVIGAEAVPIGTPRSVGGDRPALAEAPPNAVRGSGKKHCPSGYPVKGNARSKKFHLPQYGSYDQIAPEFCFKSAEAAEAAGYAPARKH
jgi:large subunit ribosomal protein L17